MRSSTRLLQISCQNILIINLLSSPFKNSKFENWNRTWKDPGTIKELILEPQLIIPDMLVSDFQLNLNLHNIVSKYPKLIFPSPNLKFSVREYGFIIISRRHLNPTFPALKTFIPSISIISTELTCNLEREKQYWLVVLWEYLEWNEKWLRLNYFPWKPLVLDSGLSERDFWTGT